MKMAILTIMMTLSSLCYTSVMASEFDRRQGAATALKEEILRQEWNHQKAALEQQLYSTFYSMAVSHGGLKSFNNSLINAGSKLFSNAAGFKTGDHLVCQVVVGTSCYGNPVTCAPLQLANVLCYDNQNQPIQISK